MTEKIMYRVTYSGRVEAEAVVKETDCFVTLRRLDWRGQPYESRLKKDGQFFPTFAAAKGSIVTKAEQAVESSLRSVEMARRSLAEALAMKEPD